MQKAEFEERDFEVALYHQLAAGSPNLWTPGQVFEHHFGVDAALKTTNKFLLSALNHTYFSRQLFLDHFNWGYVWRSYRKKHGMPSFEVNALLQAKRPAYLKGPNNAIAPLGITNEYWRFEVDQHQQRLLEKLSLKVGRRAVVSYVCPAFHLWDVLDSCIASNTLADTCSYVTPAKMINHRYWCFNAPGGCGVACSDPESVAGSTFHQLVEQSSSEIQLEASTPDAALRNLLFLSNGISEVVADEKDQNNALARAISRRAESLQQQFGTDNGGRAFAGIAIFASVVGCSWFVVGNAGA